MLQSTALAGGLGMLPVSVVAGNSGRAKTNDDDTVVLGDFEDGLDGWRTNGGNELEQITDEDIPAGVTSGEHALAVTINGDSYPMVENSRQVKGADFASYPYLGVSVIAVVDGIENDIRFRFRLQHSAGSGNPADGSGSNDRDGSQNKKFNVAVSEWKSVSQLRLRDLQWDMSDLSTEVREAAKRLEIVWYIEGHKPESGPRGGATGDVDYEGFTVFDNVRLYESSAVTEAQRSLQFERDLHRDHGMIVERNFEYERDRLERGTLLFVDGTEVSYTFEVLGDNKYEHTIDGETFRIGGGW
jgi:hypothetical protein